MNDLKWYTCEYRLANEDSLSMSILAHDETDAYSRAFQRLLATCPGRAWEIASIY